MELLRRHLFLILCGVGAVAGIALTVTGLRAMPAIETELQETAGMYQDLASLQGKPVNGRVLDATRERIEQIKSDRDAVMAKAKELYPYQPLVEGVFPVGGTEAREKFRKSYAEEMQHLWDMLRAGRPASEADVSVMKEKIEEEEFRRKRAQDGAPAADSGPETSPAGIPTKAGIRKDATARAHLAAAQRIYVYGVHFNDAKPELESSLSFHVTMKDTGKAVAPTLSNCWEAQVGFWLQKDVVEAITALNEEVAAAARDRGEDRWVGVLPIKEVISIRPSRGYIKPNEDLFFGGAPGDYKAALPAAAPKTAFTHSASSNSYEVMQFSVKLVMDQRYLQRFVERLCENRMHVPLRVAYRAVEPNRRWYGKIYGSAPVVNVVMDFESILIGDAFRSIMPKEVCEEYAIACPGVEAAAPEGGKKPPGKGGSKDED